MITPLQKITTIDEYIVTFPKEIQVILEKIRSTLHETVPLATEAIKYGMPTLQLNGKNLVHFAAFKHHIGFYPTPSGIDAFKKELSPYTTSKGAIQFPLDKPIPFDLFKRITEHRVKTM